MFERIVYVSQAAPGIGTRDAYDIIRVAHNRNSALGLTGALVFVDGWFAQVLEGESHRLEARFARIAADPRHRALAVRQRVPIEQRLFPDEWMALRLAGDLPGALRTAHGYRPGFPAPLDRGEALLAFVRACCTEAAAGAAAG